MKRTLFLFITALYCLTSFGQEPKFLLGAELSPTLATIWTKSSDDINDTRLGFSSGVNVEYFIAQSFH